MVSCVFGGGGGGDGEDAMDCRPCSTQARDPTWRGLRHQVVVEHQGAQPQEQEASCVRGARSRPATRDLDLNRAGSTACRAAAVLGRRSRVRGFEAAGTVRLPGLTLPCQPPARVTKPVHFVCADWDRECGAFSLACPPVPSQESQARLSKGALTRLPLDFRP